MKRTISLWLGLLAFALTPVLAQPNLSGPSSKIHGHVTGPEGTVKTAGTVTLSTDGGKTPKFSFPLNADGSYSGTAAPGTYTIVFRAPDTPADRMVDSIDGVKVVAGQDILQDVDMSRKEFIDKLSPDEKKQLEEIRKKNAGATKANEVIKAINADLAVVVQDFKDADGARAAATLLLGGTPTRADLEAKETEIKTAKYTEIETLMLKDSAAKPDASVLWARLGQAQVGLKKYDDAKSAYQKVIDLESKSAKPNLQSLGAANAGLGEIYARAGMVPEANAAYDAAAKAFPEQAVIYLRNEAIIFNQTGNSDAQVAAVEEAIKIDPAQPILYYLKGQGLIGKSTLDPKSQKLVPPPGCLEAYQKYLELAPTGQYAAEVKSIISSFDQKIETNVNVRKKK
jgi:tetratricopeptide (TPR) repeat protein